MSALLLIACAFAPWLTVLPLGGSAAVLARVLTFAAALHGAGHVLAFATKHRRVAPLLAMQWGAALLIGIMGLAIASGVARAPLQILLVCAFALVHTIVIVVRLGELRGAVDERLAEWRTWLVPVVLLVALAILHVLGSAGAFGAHPFDDDGHLIAQLQRLRDTGALGDAIGYPRLSQLGGQAALTALATIPDDVHVVRLLEGLAMPLALALAASRARLGDAHTTLWAVLVLIAAAALPYVARDPSAWWTAIGLILALHVMIAANEPPPAVPTGIVAGALMTLHHELIPIALAALFFAGRRGPRTRRHWVAVVAAALAVVLPFVIARASAWWSLPSEVRALLAPARGGLAAKLAIAAAVLVACAPIVLGVRGSLRWLGLGVSLSFVGIASQLTGDRPYATQFAWPIAIAAGLIWLGELARARDLRIGTLVAVLLLATLIYDGRSATGPRRWARRYLDLAANIEYLRRTGGDAPLGGRYDALLAAVPRGSTVAVWVERPERLPYGNGLHLVDLRTPRTARLRVHRFDAHRSRLAELVRASGATFLLLEHDDRAYQRRLDSYLYRFVCTTPSPACLDDLEALAAGNRVIAESADVRLVQLTP